MQINGEELRITPASFAEAVALQRAVGAAIKGSNISLPEDANIGDASINISEIMDLVISVGISPEVEEAVFVCAKRALLGTKKIDREFFETVENREHYYPIMLEVARVNLSPFFKNLASMFTGLGLIGTKSQKSE